MNCSFFGGAPADAQAPFNFYSFGADGARSGPVPFAAHAASGLCYFPTATCTPNLVPEGKQCCERSDYGESLPNQMYLLFAITPGLVITYVSYRCQSCSKRFQERGLGSWHDQYGEMDKQIEEKAADLMPKNSWVAGFGFLCFAAALSLVVQVNIQMNEIAQAGLTVPNRNGMIVAEGVLSPMDDIFSFIDDIMMVKVGIALAAGDAGELRRVFLLGSFGGFALGTLGALIASFIAFVGPVRDAVLAPFAVSPGGCPLSASDAQETAVYFALSAWQWPFSFAMNAFSGFAIAIGDLPMFGFIMLAKTVTAFVLILVAFAANPSLELLGWIRLGSTALGFCLWCLSTLRPGIRQRLSGGERGSATATVKGFMEDESTRKSLKDGLCAMLVELTVELARTITLFVTAKQMGVAAFYQVSTHFTLQVSGGLGIAEAIFQQMKLQGSKMLAAGLNYHFVWFWEYMAFGGLAISIASAVGTYTSLQSLAFKEGENACVFASDESCLLEYGNFFGGHVDAVGSTMMTTAAFVTPVVFVRIAYRICRSTLYCMQDFEWMVKVSALCFALFFLPAIVWLGAASKSAAHAVCVMTVPNLTVFCFFAWRVKGHLQELNKGTNAVYERKSSYVKQRTGELGTAQAGGGGEAPAEQKPAEASGGEAPQATFLEGQSPSTAAPPEVLGRAS